MRILFITGEYPPQPGGVGDYTQRLAQTLASTGYEVMTLTAAQGRWRLWQATSSGDKALPTPRNGASWRLLAAVRLVKIVRRLRPTWCHIQYQTGAYNLQIGVNMLPLLLRRTGITTAITYHDLLPPYLFPKAGPVRNWVTLLPARSATAVVVTNPEDEATLRAAGIQPRLIPIGANIEPSLPPDYDRDAWRTCLGVTANEALIGYFGLLSPGKGIDLLIDVVASQPDWHLLIIGGGATSPTDRTYADSVQQRLTMTGLRHRVIVTGHVTATQVSAYLSACDVIALPFRDGASLRRGSLLAALAHGCVIVTTPPASAATAAALTGAVQFAAAQPDAFTAAISALLDNPAARTRLGEAARAVARRFDWQLIAAAHSEMYQALR
ncbi:glycosyltransferase [uncultured Chloroflexus sp.]|uniref:glycosyltransferase n=1 Tax=uncultured Chloroflexus sp. TaxID=214040 RepID=UPI00261F1707|nr:glycosyltransferase [uncultured Chloroflexus sp.]